MTGSPDVELHQVFDDGDMQQRLPESVYKSYKRSRETGEALEADVADVIATALKDWALERGVSFRRAP